MADSKKNILDKPYSDRQFIIFVNDEVVVAHERTEAIISEDRKYSITPDTYLEYLKAQLKSQDIDEFARIVGLMRNYFHVRREGVNIRLVEKSQIPLFTLYPGHPRDNLVYAGHPALPKTYIPLADFHRAVFEHKFSEMISLLINLGGQNVHIRHLKGWGLEYLLQLNTTIIPQLNDEVRVKSLMDIYKSKVTAQVAENETGAKDNTEQIVLINTIQKMTEAPRIPENMVWYPFEPTWQWVCEGRLKSGLKQFVLHLSYREDFDINAGLKIKLEKAGFNVGGEFEQHVPTMWRVFGEFWN